MKNNIDKILTEPARAEMMGLDYMFENRGVYDKATAIIDECLDLIKERLGEAQLLRVENDKNVYYLEIISDLKTDCFMKNIRLMIYLNVPREGYVVEIKKSAVFAHTKDLTIENYGTEEKPIWKAFNTTYKVMLVTERKDKFPAVVFSNNMIHEIHHAYRWYQISLGGEEAQEDEKNRRDAYQNYMTNCDSEVLSIVLYNSEQDEVNAFASEVYDVIRHNPEITVDNCQFYYDKFEIWRKIETLQSALKNYKKYTVPSAQSYWNGIARQVNGFYHTNMTPGQTRKWLIERISYALTYMQRQFYKVLGKALMDFYPRQMIEWKDCRCKAVSLAELIEREIKLSNF